MTGITNCTHILKFLYISILLLSVTIVYMEFVFLDVWVCCTSRVLCYEFWLEFWSIFSHDYFFHLQKEAETSIDLC